MSDKGSLIKKQGQSNGPCVRFQAHGDYAVCQLIGNWQIEGAGTELLYSDLERFVSRYPALSVYKFLTEELEEWDSSLVVYLNECEKKLVESGKVVDLSQLPSGVLRLIKLSQSRKFSRKKSEFSFDAGIDIIENEMLRFRDGVANVINFWGEWIGSLSAMVCGKSSMRIGDLISACRACGASALAIVTLISFLTGLTMAFVGSVQLEKFNAKIYVADLVCLAMVREMGALMVAIVMAGRTGAAFAAELGSMKINEEIDSLRTFGISPMQFLVLPRTLGLLLMTPLLTLYADVVGILGGLTVATQVMDFSALHYFEQTQTALRGMWEVYSGLIKSLAFGLIIGLVGCYKGLGSGKDSASLGRAVTSAVVTSVTLIVIVDALFEITFSCLDLR